MRNTPKIRFKGFSDDWEQRKFENIAIRSSSMSTESGLPRVEYEDIISETGRLNKDIFAKKSVKAGIVFHKDDVLYGKLRPYLKNWFLPSFKGLAVGDFWVLQPQNTDNSFLYRLIQTCKFDEVANQSTGTKMPRADWKLVSKTDFSVPYSIDEQSAIGTFFTDLDTFITLHQCKGDVLKKIKQALLQKLFPENGSLIPELRFKGFTEPWEQRKLGDVVQFLDTQRQPLEEAKRIKGPYPYYGASGIVDYVNGYLFSEELILLSEDGANITDRNYPVCFLAKGKYWVNNHAHVLKADSGNDNAFICNSLERKDFSEFNTGMAMPKLNKKVCHDIPVICPSYEEQREIGNFILNLDNLITLHQRKCDSLKKLKQSLLQKMFV